MLGAMVYGWTRGQMTGLRRLPLFASDRPNCLPLEMGGRRSSFKSTPAHAPWQEIRSCVRKRQSASRRSFCVIRATAVTIIRSTAIPASVVCPPHTSMRTPIGQMPSWIRPKFIMYKLMTRPL